MLRIAAATIEDNAKEHARRKMLARGRESAEREGPPAKPESYNYGLPHNTKKNIYICIYNIGSQ